MHFYFKGSYLLFIMYYVIHFKEKATFKRGNSLCGAERSNAAP